MNSRAKEFMGVVCWLYLAGILVAVPLYMKEGYWQIGDGKYELFRNLSIICAGCWLVVSLIQMFSCKGWKNSIKWSWMDSFVLGYGAVNIVSYWGSVYRETAWEGNVQWYMGLFSQLLFVWIYFFVSRWFDGKPWVLLVGQAGLTVVVAVGIVNRLGLDILGVYQEFDVGSWDSCHLLSTVGNVNWLCGYLSVGLAFAFCGYFLAESKAASCVQFLICGAGVVLSVIQGSDSGLAVACVLVVISCAVAGMSMVLFRKVMVLGMGICFGFYLMYQGMDRRGAWDRLPLDDKGRYVLGFDGWWIVALLLAFGLGISFWIERRSVDKKIIFSGKGKRIMYSIAFLLFVSMLAVGMMILLQIKSQGIGWGNGRGGLWTLAVRGFQEGSFWQKLVGAGPDCFGKYIYDEFSTHNYIVQPGRWENAVFVNAHNEWLTLLVNTGLLGAGCYLGIFITGFIRYGRRAGRDLFLWLGVMAIAAYGVNALVSFQQVVSTPLLFAVLGLSENRCREEGTI